MRLSPLHEALEHLHPTLGELGGMQVPMQFGAPAQEADQARVLALTDVSALSRIVIKGPEAAGFLESQQVSIPAEILQVEPLGPGGLVARTGSSEFFLEDGWVGDFVERIESAVGSGKAGVYPVLRQDASLFLSGSRAAEAFRHTCPYNFATSKPGDKLVMTRVANVSCSVLPRDFQGIPVFQVWTDGTYGVYLWEALLQVVQELGGHAVGLTVFRG